MNLVQVPFELDPQVFSEDAESGLTWHTPPPGIIHLSDLIQDMVREREEHTAARVGPVGKPRHPYGSPEREQHRHVYTEEHLRRFRAMGFIWERVLRQQLERTGLGLVRPGRFEVDGIRMTPDGVCTWDWTLEEWKCTYKSARNPIEDMWTWWIQIKAYARTLACEQARLRVLHVCGDYTPPAPMWRCWQRGFERWELDENWDMLLRRRDAVLARMEVDNGQ